MLQKDYKTLVLVRLDCLNNIPQIQWLKQQRGVFAQFWGLEVRDQGPRMVELCSPSLAYRQPPSLCAHMAFPQCMVMKRELSFPSSSYKANPIR